MFLSVKQVRANAVSGKMIYTDGRWCTCIGNSPVRVGDYVYTDGRCIYGNVIEAGRPYIPPIIPNEGIPILTDDGKLIQFYTFGKGKLKQNPKNVYNSQGQWNHTVMVNTKNKAHIFWESQKEYSSIDPDRPEKTIDAEYSINGGIFTIENFSYSYGRYKNDKLTIGTANLKLNNILIDNYAEKCRNLLDEYNLGDGGRILIYNARMDIDGHYSIFGEIDTDSDDEYNEYNSHFILSNGNVNIIDEWTTDREYGGKWINNHKVIDNIKIPMADGFYFTFDWPKGYQSGSWDVADNWDEPVPQNDGVYVKLGIYPDDVDTTFHIYDQNDNLILTLKDMSQKLYVYDNDGNLKKYKYNLLFRKYPLSYNLQICKLKGNGYLLLVNNVVGVFEDDKFIILNFQCRNFRLREMKDIKKWKHEAKKHINQNKI